MTRSFFRVFAALVLLSVLSNLAAQWHTARTVDFSSESGRVAQALLEGRGFSDPFLTGRSGPTAHVAPLYPYVVAGICMAFGTGAAGWAAILLLTAAAWAFQWAYAYRFAAEYGQALPGLIAAVIGVVVPLQGRLFKWEAVLTGAAIAYSAWALSQVLKGRSGSAALRLGAGLAVTVLVCPSAILVWPAWAVLCVWRLGLSRGLKTQAPALILIVIPLALWTVRNWVTFHRLFFIRDSLGLELNIAYNDCASPLLSGNISSGCFAQQHPSGNPELLATVRRVGEVEFAQEHLRRAKSWIAAHPAKAVKLTLAHIGYFWFPLEASDPKVLAYGILMSIVTVLSIAGLFWKSEATVILILTMLPFSAVYCLTQFEQRYRYPILWASAILAAVGVRLVMCRVRRAR